MIATETKHGSESEGCWFDCARGQYIGDCVIREAIARGWKCNVPPTDDPPTWAPTPSWADHEHYCELWDEAEQYMDQFAEEGFWFGASEGGDWGLWRSEEDEG